MIKFLCIFLFPTLSFADSFFVQNLSGQSNQLNSTINSLVKSEIISLGHTVSNNASAANWKLIPTVLVLGNSHILSLTKTNGQHTFSQKAKTRNIDEFDVVVERLVTSVVKEKKFASSVEVDNVTEREELGTTVKKEVTRQYYVGFGPGKGSNLETSNAGVSWTVGLLWGLDHQFSLRAGLESMNIQDSGAGMTALELGGQYYFNKQQHAPYVLGMIGYSWAQKDSGGANCSFFCRGVREHGWSTQIGAGMHFFRASTVNLAVEAFYDHGFYDITENHAPGVYGARIIVLW